MGGYTCPNALHWLDRILQRTKKNPTSIFPNPLKSSSTALLWCDSHGNHGEASNSRGGSVCPPTHGEGTVTTPCCPEAPLLCHSNSLYLRKINYKHILYLQSTIKKSGDNHRARKTTNALQWHLNRSVGKSSHLWINRKSPIRVPMINIHLH